MKIAISSIIVGERGRKNFGDMNALALSIQANDLIQPIVVEQREDGYHLIAGERRLRAHMMLQRTEIEAVFRTDLSDLQRLELELEENLHRKSFEWQEEVDLKAQIDELKRKQAGETPGRSKGAWTIHDTAQLLGVSPGQVSNDLTLAKAIKQYPELKKEKNKEAAFKKFKLLEEQRMRKILAERMRDRGVSTEISKVVHHGDCVEVLKSFPESSVNLVVVDPPYGIEYQDIGDDVEKTGGHQSFDDSKEGALETIELMLHELNRVMTKDSNIFMFFGLTLMDRIKGMLEKYFDVDPLPLIWFKPNIGGGRTLHPDVYACRSYETIFYARRGNKPLVKAGQPNVLIFDAVPPKKKIHLTEKPTALIRELIERASVEGEVVLDPCAGSGSALVAARQIGRRFIGIEKDEHNYNRIVQRLGKVEDAESSSAPTPEAKVAPAAAKASAIAALIDNGLADEEASAT